MRKAFTLLEIIIVLVIVGLVGILGLYAFKVMPENAKARTCEANLRILRHAMELYIQDNDRMPSSVSRIPQKYIDRAYASLVHQQDSWEEKLVYFFQRFCQDSVVYAKPFINSLSPTDLGLVTCPKDKNPPDQNNLEVSYGLNQGLVGITIKDYQLLNNTTYLIGDCKSTTFGGIGGLDKRHVNYGKHVNYGQVIRKDGFIERPEGGFSDK